ncbi:unnamed protein product [Tuber melanosporum]|uniref:Small acidic protein n=1 Tax=Tuber melanosporum (strain Mel28) TaxID=656061 RepID=D5GPQ0_TUBMM|nr:uncharacterized protein GSTUM_00011969001 [Tuber melanosporum]CAZ86493.1 unnamed protein product [Tuber melanosporum]
MSPEGNFAGINPERLKMLQARENPAPRDFSGRGRDRGWGQGGRGAGSGSGRGGGRGGYRATGRRFVFNEGAGSPAVANGGTKESTPAEEQLSGAEMRLAFKRNQERKSGAVVENCANSVKEEERKRKRDDEGAVAAESSPPKTSKRHKDSKTNGVTAATNGAPTLDEKRKHKKKKEKRDDRAKRAKRHAIEVGEVVVPSPSGARSSKQLNDDPDLSKEAKKAAKKERKEKREKRRAAIIEEPVNGDVGPSEHTSGSKTKTKKDKKPKKGKSKEPSSSSTDPTPAKRSKKSKTEILAGEAEYKWTAVAADLPGDDQRKSKFLRLLGAGAGALAATVPTANGSASLSSSSAKTREKDLERQYDAGLKVKGKKRRGLGA